MPYIEGRIVHDADSHVMEPPGWYDPWLDDGVKQWLGEQLGKRNEKFARYIEKVVAKHSDPEFRAGVPNEVNLRKGMEAHGAFLKEDRPAALDHLGFSSQLVFTTALLGPLLIAEQRPVDGEPDLPYRLAEGHNRAVLDFCSVDPRLLPVGYLPLADIDRTCAFVKDAVAAGCAGLMVSSMPPKNHSPSHIGLDPVWATMAEAGVPVVFHVGGGVPMNPIYKENGLPPVKDFAGGDANFTSVSFLPIANAPMQTIGTMIIDQVLQRFPNLKIGVIEQGASWVPGWMRSMDAASDAFMKNEERLQTLELKPSEFVQRQVRVTPYPHEDVGWIIKNTGPDVCMFSSDYPHIEGGRNPVKRFEASMDAAGCDEVERDGFYCNNMVDLMGPVLDRLKQPATA